MGIFKVSSKVQLFIKNLECSERVEGRGLRFLLLSKQPQPLIWEGLFLNAIPRKTAFGETLSQGETTLLSVSEVQSKSNREADLQISGPIIVEDSVTV